LTPKVIDGGSFKDNRFNKKLQQSIDCQSIEWWWLS